MTNLYKALVSISAGLLVAAPCRAVDYQPFDWVPAPRHTNVLMGYYQFSTNNNKNSHLDNHIGIARYLHYDEAFGKRVVLDLILPFGALTDAKIAGDPIGAASGVGDPTLSVGLWVVNEPLHGRYVSAASFLSVPIGNYDSRRALNLGHNRWQHDMQVDFTQTVLDAFTVDVSGVWTYYANNNDAGATHQTLSQDSSWTAYAWLTYEVTPAARRSLSIGYAGMFGGAVKLDGVPTGSKTEEHQIRLSYSQFILPTWQTLLSVSRDLSATGQLKQDVGLLLRVAKAF